MFNLEQQNETVKENIEEGKFLFVSRKELSELIDKNQTHGDLLAIYDILVSVKSKMKPYPQISMNNCTFTCRKKQHIGGLLKIATAIVSIVLLKKIKHMGI